eukprot:m.28033 g.28033  ORF g.28033 m.28033 type:complete len:420 (-) comp15849_c0_seq1:1028-2287(-)
MLKVFSHDEVQLFSSGKPAPKASSASRDRSGSVGSSSTTKKAIPKKDGHGKGSWGKIGSEIKLPQDDYNDPNYVPPKESPIDLVETKYTISKQDMLEFLKDPMEEYFGNGIVNEILRPIKEIATDDLNHEITAFVLREACLKTNAERELASQLLLELVTSGAVTSALIQKGVNTVLKDIDDISLDAPDVDFVLGKFIARGVADEIIPPKFALSYNIEGKPEDDKVRRCIKKARGLINTPQGLARLEHVWGISGALSPVKNVKQAIKTILMEYVDSSLIDEAGKCIRELKAAYFHHEVVYSMVLIAIESGDHQVIQTMVSLLQALGSKGENLISDTQLKTGLDRILVDIHDIAIDVPLVKKHLASFYRLAAPCIPDSMKLTNERLYPEVPEDELEEPPQLRTNNRKRSVSLTAEQQEPRR